MAQTRFGIIRAVLLMIQIVMDLTLCWLLKNFTFRTLYPQWNDILTATEQEIGWVPEEVRRFQGREKLKKKLTFQRRNVICFISGTSAYRAVNTFQHGYKKQSVNDVQSKSYCLFWYPHKTLNVICFISGTSPYRAVNTFQHGYKKPIS
jgi:hypothetical protein